jgi:adenylate cyclase
MTVEDPTADGLTEAMLRHPRRYTSHEVAEMAGVPVYRARRFWRALGFANVGDEAREFTDADVAALRTLLGLARDSMFDEQHVLLLTRVLGQATARLAESQAELSGEALNRAGVAPAERAGTWQRAADELLPDLERLLVYAWRRQLAAAAGRLLQVEHEPGIGHLAVGFADLVGFTRLSRRVEDGELARLVERFEGRSADVITAAGGRVVKTLGDSVLFVADTAHGGADIAQRLVETHAPERRLPPLRLGVAIGPVIGRMGDVFGTTVNLASRLTALAPPDQVLVDPAMAAELAGDPDFDLRPVDPVTVRGLGEVEPFIVTRSGSTRPPTARPAG